MRTLLLFAIASTSFAQIPDAPGTPVQAFALRYVELKSGEGAAALPGKRFTVHYTGWLADGTKFDSSRDRNEPIQFVQGRRMVIAGWEAGFDGMKTGGRRRLLIPYQMAYGEKGSGPIPPRADLTFDVELLAVEDAPEVLPGVDVMEPLKELERKVVALANAIPEEKYSWRPSPGVRSVSEVLLHIAYGNKLMFDIGTEDLAGEALRKQVEQNAKHESDKLAKQEIVRMVTASFEPIRKYLDTARAGTLGRDMTFFGTPLTRRGIFVFIDTHIAEHMGQLIAYARMNGVRPPWS